MTSKTPHAYLTDILNARVYDVAQETALDHVQLLSCRLGNRILLKREDQQPAFCYKIRGAYHKMTKLTDAQRHNGVVAASAGNHAIGVAMSAYQLGCHAVVVMPQTAPEVKVDAVKRWGAEVRLVGDNFDSAAEHAAYLARAENRLLIPPFDDPAIIAGQGTVGMEILKQSTQPPDVVFLPVGGGGLAAGVAVYIKQVQPRVRIVGVEPEDSNAMTQSVAAGHRLKLKQVGIFADGVAVKQVGKETFRLCRDLVDEFVCVNTDEICAAIKDIFEDTRTLVEPSGALGVAGIKRWLKIHEQKRGPIQNRNLVAVCSGANINFDRLRHISERAEIGERREAILAVTIPERPGSFREFCRQIGNRQISEFNYRYAEGKKAYIFVGVQIRKRNEADELVDMLESSGFPTQDLTDNEIAKVHARHMVGGRAPGLQHERVFSFEIPERVGALREFLDQLGEGFNITLFHYRNHGADFGRVLCGITVPPDRRKIFNGFLRDLGYIYREETDNPAYRLFLS